MATTPTLADIKRAMQPGQVYDVTNHYITRPDHPCYGTRRATVIKVNGASFYLGGARWGTPWPKASQAEMDADGTIRLYGGGAGQASNELFLTLAPVLLLCGDCYHDATGLLAECEDGCDQDLNHTGRCNGLREGEPVNCQRCGRPGRLTEVAAEDIQPG